MPLGSQGHRQKTPSLRSMSSWLAVRTCCLNSDDYGPTASTWLSTPIDTPTVAPLHAHGLLASRNLTCQFPQRLATANGVAARQGHASVALLLRHAAYTASLLKNVLCRPVAVQCTRGSIRRRPASSLLFFPLFSCSFMSLPTWTTTSVHDSPSQIPPSSASPQNVHSRR